MRRHHGVNGQGPVPWPAAHGGGGTVSADGSRQPGPANSAAPARQPRPPWLAGVWTGGILLGGCVATAFATAALWQLGAVIDALVEAARATSVTSPPVPVRGMVTESTPGMPQSSAMTKKDATIHTLPVALDSEPLHTSRAPSPSFEPAAEASEKPVALGAEAEPEYVRTECDDVFVYIVSIAEAAPMASAASLAVGKTSPARLRRPGQRIGGWEVLAITEDSSGVNPAVWLLKGNAVCRAELAGNPARVHVPLKQERKPPVVRRRRRGRR